MTALRHIVLGLILFLCLSDLRAVSASAQWSELKDWSVGAVGAVYDVGQAVVNGRLIGSSESEDDYSKLPKQPLDEPLKQSHAGR